MPDRPERLIAVDTNLLVDSVRPTDSEEDAALIRISKGIIGSLERKGTILSAQSLTELYNATTRQDYLDEDSAHELLERLMHLFDIVPVTRDDVREASALMQRHRISRIWDPVLLATFCRAGCRYFLTGDKAVARLGSYKGMEIINPHEEGFDFDALLDSCREIAAAEPPAGDFLTDASGDAADPAAPAAADGPGDDVPAEDADLPICEFLRRNMPEQGNLLEAVSILTWMGFTVRFGKTITIEEKPAERQEQSDT